jgi:hypothetical protein
LVYGTAVWDPILLNTEQQGLIINRGGLEEPALQVDELEVAQFINLLLNNQRLRMVIDVVARKVILILGRFTDERKPVLDRIAVELRNLGFVPVLVDFPTPTSRNITETISTIAHLAHLVIADITDPRSVPQELQRIVPDLPSVPVQPLLVTSNEEYGMFRDFRDHSNVLPVVQYSVVDEIASLLEHVILPRATAFQLEVRKRRTTTRVISP